MIDSDDRLHISEVKHKTYPEVDEEGAEASGATNIGMETTSIPAEESFDITFDYPFFMMIAIEATGAVLFIGNIHNAAA